MNTSTVRVILGHVLQIEAALMLPAFLVGMIYRETQGFVYLIVACCLFLFGTIFTIRKPKNRVFYLKEGCVITALSWIFLSVFGCIPFMLTGEIPHFVDALFETASGLTTTGASILTNVEAMSHASLFWRSFMHWIGGMGVLVFLLAILPLTGGSNINLMKAESAGPSVGKLVPKIKSSAQILYFIYLGFTVVEFLFLAFGGMPIFDSICLTFGTAGTGGFGVLNDSIASYSAYHQWVIGIFMVLFGVNFNFYYFILHRKYKKAIAIEEVRWYLVFVLVSTAVIFFYIMDGFSTAEEGLRTAFFQVSSIITTTGYSTVDFNQWATLPKLILLLLMISGGCAGSTAGGLKVSRIVIMIKTFLKESRSYLHPKSVKRIKMNDEPLEHDILRSTNVYLVTYIMIFILSLALVCIEGQNLETSFTAVLATLNNIGPGLDGVGPSSNFAGLTDLSKVVLTIDMLVGRLEIFPMVILLHPGLWHEAIVAKRHEYYWKRHCKKECLKK